MIKNAVKYVLYNNNLHKMTAILSTCLEYPKKRTENDEISSILTFSIGFLNNVIEIIVAVNYEIHRILHIIGDVVILPIPVNRAVP